MTSVTKIVANPSQNEIKEISEPADVHQDGYLKTFRKKGGCSCCLSE
jgi:hypothetical protein